MSFILKPVDIVENITPEDFKKNYLKTKKPLVIRGLTKDGLPEKSGLPNI